MVLLSRACCGSVGPGELRGCETIATSRKCGNILASSLTSITKRCGMTVSLLALDYSRPIQPLFAQASRAGSIHSAFHHAVNITLDDTMLSLLSSELPRMPNSARLPPVVAAAILHVLRPGIHVWLGN